LLTIASSRSLFSHGQADASERRFEFVTRRRDEIVFDLIEQSQPSDVLKQHGRAERIAVRIANGQNPRQHGPLATVGAQEDDVVKPLGRVVPLLFERVGQRLTQWLGRLPSARRRLPVVFGQDTQ
jgi:hypothetical protein